MIGLGLGLMVAILAGTILARRMLVPITAPTIATINPCAP